MTTRTVPFNYVMFYAAMVGLIGREPDKTRNYGGDGTYMFRYEPKDEGEAKQFAKETHTLREWLTMFDLIPFRSQCDYGYIPVPFPGEEGKVLLFIDIVHVVDKEE